MAEVRDVAFELERFAWTPPDRLEVVGRWSGLEGRRLGRPVLTLAVAGEKVRLTSHPGGRFSRSGQWSAVFSFDGEPEDVAGAELEIGRRLVIDLPPPRRRKAPVDTGELEREQRRREELEATLAERDAEITGLRDEAETALGERDSRIEALEAEMAEMRTKLEEAEQERELMRAELEAARAETQTARAEVDASAERLQAERAAAAEIREKLATAREEAQSTIDTEAHETERLRAELQAAREETERTIEAERAETARLREELATHSANGGDEDGSGESQAAAKRMYERVASELERERAAARSLRRELDAVQAKTAEHRRLAASAAADGIDPTDDIPAAATPVGRLVASRRSEVGRAAAHHRAEAARAAAAQRLPSHRSPVAIWVVRAIAVAIVAGLLVALLLIVSAVT
jgi:DNA repair exonuclease SbcCD ATPase subunit